MRFIILALLSLLSVSAAAADGCFDEAPIVDRTDTWDFAAGPREDFYLPTRNTYGLFLTPAAAHFEWSGGMRVSFDHFLPADKVGIQYTVHRLQIQIGADDAPDKFIFDQDLTFGCTEPGLSFFPRQTVRLPDIKMPLPMNENTPVRIRIWGHL